MKKRISTLLFILLACSGLWAQEQLTNIRGLYGPSTSPAGPINYIIKLNKQIVWTSTEENGVNLYTSDGTKEGTRLLSNVLSSIPTLHHSFDTWSIRGDELLYRITPSWDNAQMYHDFTALHFVTNGTDKTLKLFEAKDFIEGSSAVKIGENYYYIYGQKENDVLILKLFKVYPDGKQEIVKTIDLAKEDASIIDVRFIENVGELYFKVIIAPDYLLSSSKDLIINPINGEIVNKNEEVYLTNFRGKVFFYKYDELSKKYATYATDGSGLVKLFESENMVKVFTPNPDDEEIIFYDNDNWWITDGTVAETKYVKSLYESFNMGMQKKINGGYLFCDFGFRQWQIYTNGTMKKADINIPGIDFDSYPKSVVYNNKFYFNAMGWSDSLYKKRLMVYVFDGNDVRMAVDLSNYELNNRAFSMVLKNGGMIFSITPFTDTFENTVVYWHPTMNEGIFIAKGFVNDIYITEDNKAIIRIEEKQGTIYEDINYQLYISDLKIPARLITSKVFVQKGVTIEEGSHIIADKNILGNKLYFSAYSPETGYEPWVTDGTEEGTKMVGDLLKGPQSSHPTNFMEVNGIPVCRASTPDTGRQLFSLLPKLDSPILSVPNTQACEGDTIVLTSSKGYDTYKWIIDEDEELTTTENKLSISKSGTYKVIVSKGNASSLPSNAVSINFVALPPKPVIKQENNQLRVTATGQVQWYLNGSVIAGATTHTLTYNGAGDYTVKLTANGCSVLSDKLLVSITATEEIWADAVYPNPASNQLMVKVNQNFPVQLKLIDIKGRMVLEKTLVESVNVINLEDFAKGVYILRLNEYSKKIIIE
ncbi:T9SS type A sorting domain-containing protein [Emticicia agri]|nr:T9SS type A sorting domain-containing protein [Emticicia agri]